MTDYTEAINRAAERARQIAQQYDQILDRTRAKVARIDFQRAIDEAAERARQIAQQYDQILERTRAKVARIDFQRAIEEAAERARQIADAYHRERRCRTHWGPGGSTQSGG